MSSIFGFLFSSRAPDIVISFEDQENRLTEKPKFSPNSSQSENVIIYSNLDTIKGKVFMNLPANSRIEHLGLKIELFGQIEPYFDRGNNMKFLSRVRELSPAGILTESKEYNFDFSKEMPYESYYGINLRLRYFVKVTLSRNYGNNLTQERDIWIQVTQNPTTLQNDHLPVKLEVGIEDCLHIEFEYNKNRYHLNDVILGQIFFTLSRIKIKSMELCIIKRESCNGNDTNFYNESQNIVKYELMDGVPVKGESIPVRLYLSSLENLTPTYRSIHNIFSVKYLQRPFF